MTPTTPTTPTRPPAEPSSEPHLLVVPAPAKVPRLGRHPTAGQLVQRAIGVAARHLVRHDAIMRQGDDPEAVHQMRVALRRVRSDLRTFSDLLDPDWASSVKELARPVAAALGARRDLDVLLERLQAQRSRLPITEQAGIEPVIERLLAQREPADAAVRVALASSGYHELLGRLGDLEPALRSPSVSGDDEQDPGAGKHSLEQAVDQPADLFAEAAVERAFRRLRRQVRALPDPAPDQALHDLRIRVKRVRYAAEAAAPVLGRPAARLAADLTRLQSLLGDHQDAVTAVAWLRNLVDVDVDGAGAGAGEGAPDIGVAWAAGLLAGLELADATEARRRFDSVWTRVEAHKQRRWLQRRPR